MAARRPVQEQLALTLGLAVSTVSRALRGAGRISAATRRRVALAAAELGYRPPAPAPGWGAARPRLLVVTAARSGAASPEGTWPRVTAVLRRLAERGHRLELRSLSPTALARFAAQLEAASSPAAEGILLLQRHDPAVVARLAARLPVASVIFAYPGLLVDVAAPDNEAAGRLLAEHLLARGHRRIGWLGHGLEQDWHRARLGGFLAQLAACGRLPARADLAVDGGGAVALRQEVVARAWRRIQEGTAAWACANDHLAHALLERCRDAGMAAPGRVAVAGIDELPPRPGLPLPTSVRMPVEACAEEAVALLEWRIAHPGAACRRVVLPPRLVAGSTT